MGPLGLPLEPEGRAHIHDLLDVALLSTVKDVLTPTRTCMHKRFLAGSPCPTDLLFTLPVTGRILLVVAVRSNLARIVSGIRRSVARPVPGQVKRHLYGTYSY